MGEPHNSSKPAAPQGSALTGIPVRHEGELIGYAELKDGILTADLFKHTASRIVEGLSYGLVSGLSLDTINTPAFPAPNQTRMEI